VVIEDGAAGIRPPPYIESKRRTPARRRHSALMSLQNSDLRM
jgi:hypothetical protein